MFKRLLIGVLAFMYSSSGFCEYESQVYQVKSGDYLLRISKQFYGSTVYTKNIVEWNNIKNPDLIYTGQKLILFFAKPEVKKIQTISNAAVVEPPVQPRYFSIAPGLGFTQVNHQESDVASYSTLLLTGKISLRYAPPESKFDFSLSTYATVAQFYKSRSDTLRFLGVNFRTGYALVSMPNSEWIVSAQSGVFYTTMFVSGNAFGYKNLIGPQLYPLITRKLENEKLLSLYLKASLLLNNGSVLNFNNREIASGLIYTIPIARNNAMNFSFDFSELEVTILKIAMKTETYSLGVGYAF